MLHVCVRGTDWTETQVSSRRTFKLAHSLCLYARMAVGSPRMQHGSPRMQHVWSELLQHTLPLVAEQHCTVQISGNKVYKPDPPVENETAPRRSSARHSMVFRVARLIIHTRKFSYGCERTDDVPRLRCFRPGSVSWVVDVGLSSFCVGSWRVMDLLRTWRTRGQ